MADTQKTSAPASPGRTLDEVMQMFAALGLPVCDDADAIQKKIDAQTERFQRDKNGSDPKRRLLADIWFKNASDLIHSRAELIDIVRAAFADDADFKLDEAKSQGLNELSEALVDKLRTILRKRCRVDDQLAERFLDRYMKERGFKIKAALVKPALVESLSVLSQAGKISLKWVTPVEKCDRVLIVRSSEQDRIDEEEFEVSTNLFEDNSASAGNWYVYRVYSKYQEVTSTGYVQARGVCIGEVNKATPVWKNGEVLLTWQSPGSHSSVQIFRCENTPPHVLVAADGPTPHGATIRLYRGAGETFTDTKIKEGATYFYKIVAEFGEGYYSRGVDLQITIPHPPPATRSLKAEYKRDADKDLVLLEWQTTPGLATPEYVVVRREGEAPAGRIEEGTHVKTTSQNRCLDENVVAGHRYTYAVFTRSGGLCSRSGTAAEPVDILAEVTELAANTADGTVELSWKTPLNVSSIAIRRSLQPPRDHSDGTPVKLAGAGHAKDDGLRNEQRYNYLVSCGYRPAGTSEVFSPGVRIAAVPVLLPDSIVQFSARTQGREVICTWKPPAQGQPVLLRSDRPHGLPIGHRLKAEEMNGLGERIVTPEGGRAADTRPELSRPYYAIFSVAGEHAVVGGTAACVVCPEVTHLTLTAMREGIVLRWKWPDGCTLVRVLRRYGRDPEGPYDPNSVAMLCTKSDYDSNGGKQVDRILEGGGIYHYTLFAHPHGSPAEFFSAGLESGCRETIEWQPVWTTIRYGISASGNAHLKSRSVLLRWTVDECAPNFDGFALVANQDGIPSSIDDGVELFRWTKQNESRTNNGPEQHELEVSLDPIQKRRWARFHAKLVVLNPAQRFTTLIIHPNVCIPISENGILQSTTAVPITRRYVRGIPKQVICPSCFSEFPTTKMLFTSFGGGDALPGKYTILDWLQKRPPTPPVNANGVKLTNKICPNCQKQLPFTAGGQASLVIGLIGAKFVGKSHYIAALIDRLATQVGGDLEAALIPTSEETAERYQREFHDPLFRNKLELPMTPGTPPPLIYDLRFSGSLWGEDGWRSVTLAFYDTAGENFDKADKVREMVNYLRHASGVILLIDPLQVEAVRQALPDNVRQPDADSMADPQQVVGRVYQELENGKVVVDNSPLGIPVAVVLTKCDVLKDAGFLDPNRLWNSDRRHRGYFDQEAHDDMVGMFGEYVRKWSPEVFHNVTQRFSRYAFFGVSSTGCASDTKTRRFKYISPWRVEDPLLWLLAELGVIPSR
jgi:hypothetical protein